MNQAYRWLIVLIISTILNPFCLARTPESQLLFSINDQNTARLGIINQSKRSVDLFIINDKGEKLYSKSISGEENLFQLFSLSNMPDGEYTVMLSGMQQIKKKQFRIKDSKAFVIKEQEEVAPIFRLSDENTLMISYLNAKNNSVNIFIMRDEDVIFAERGLTGMGINKRYSLKQLGRGAYTVKLYSGGKIYSFPLVKN